MINSCVAFFRKEREEKAVKIYYGECLRVMGENLAKFAGGSYIEAKLADVLDPKPVDNRTPEQIIGSIREKLENSQK